jgi:eukaryotic-like serine/threonine-protein kinase
MSQPAVETGLVGAVLSRRWRIASPIGSGGMGLVFVGEGVQDGRRVAIKVLRPELVSETLVRARFIEEAASTMRLHHVNILRVFEAAEAEDGSPYIVMELLDGVPLSAYVGEPVPVPQAVTILRGVLHGLGAAHAGGIVHRDLKPENVFLARDAATGQFVVKLLDFGIAKVMDVAGGMGNKTKTGMLLGTPAYMSPEQVKSSRDTDPRTDLWSAGVLFYELLSGKQAFQAPTEFARLSQILGGQPAPLPAGLASWQPFIDRALQKDRTLRFQTATEMEQALGAGGPVVSQIMSAVPRTPLAGQGPVAITLGPHVQAPAAYMPAASPPSALEATAPSPGGTLSSQRGQSGTRPSTAPPAVQLIPPPSGDLESRSFRGRDQGRRVSAIVVVALVLLALAAGFVIGFAVGRM